MNFLNLIPNNILLDKLTKEIRKELNDPSIDSWILRLEYEKNNIYFLIKNTKHLFENGKTLISDFLRLRYADFEKENKVTIIACEIIVTKDNKPLGKVYFIKEDGTKQFTIEEL